MTSHLIAIVLLAAAMARAQPDGPPTSLHAAIQQADRIVIRDGGFDCCKPVDADPVIFQVTNQVEIDAVYSNLQFAATESESWCMCCGYPGLDWYVGSNRVALAGIQHGTAIRWIGFSGDAPLTQASQDWLKNWLVPRGVNDEFMPSFLYQRKLERAKWKKELAEKNIPYTWFSPRSDGRLAFQPLDSITNLQAIAHLPIGALHLESCTNAIDIAAITNLPLARLYLNDVRVHDLSPIRGLNLTHLRASGHDLCDLSILKGMPLESVDVSSTAVSNLDPLAGMPLTHINLNQTSIRDLKPLRGMRLKSLSLENTPVSEIDALAGMPLEQLVINQTQVKDISALRDCPLVELEIDGTEVSDIRVLEGKQLNFLKADASRLTNGIESLRGMTNLHQIGVSDDIMEIGEFWEKWEAGAFTR